MSRWTEFLKAVIDDPEKVEELRDFFKNCIVDDPDPEDRRLMILAGFGQAQSVIAEVLIDLVGSDKVAYLGWELLDRFKIGMLEGKRLNVMQNFSLGILPIRFRPILAGEKIFADKKNGPAYEFETNCRFIATTPILPKLPLTIALRSRIIEFKNGIKAYGRAVHIVEGLRGEINSIREWAVS